MQTNQTEAKWISILEWIVVIAVVILAAYLRYWRIEEVPPGFNSDEAVGAMGALTTLREGIQYSYDGQGGGGTIGFYFAAASFYLFGPSIAAIRGVAAWAGVVSIFVNYWAVREVFRSMGLNRARWIAGLSTLGLAVSVWHLWPSRVAFATIGVPFLMLPSVYFLWLGLNRQAKRLNLSSLWPFILSGFFLGAGMYIYLSGVFAPPFYAAFFIGQWLTVKAAHRFNWRAIPNEAFLTARFRQLFAAALTATLLLIPFAYVLLFQSEIDTSSTRVSQAIFTNPQINQGDPWGLLWRSFTGNFAAYGVSFSWLYGEPPNLSKIPTSLGLMVFLGFLISLWRGVRGQAAYLFILLWYAIMLFPSILAPDVIPHDLRTIGATTPAYVFAAIFVVWLFEMVWLTGRRRLQPILGRQTSTRLAQVVVVILAAGLAWLLWQGNARALHNYFYVFPYTNDAEAAFHIYAVEMARAVNQEPSSDVAFILPRNTAAGDVNRNFTTDFLIDLEQPPAAHFWVVDDERTLADDLSTAAADHHTLRIVRWKTSKHTGADPKEVIPYYLEKYGHYERTDRFDYFDIHTYQLETSAPDFKQAETLTPAKINFGGQIELTGYAFGDAGNPDNVKRPQAAGNDDLWLRLKWQKIGDQAEDLKASALIYGENGQLVAQVDKLLLSNILHVSSSRWEVGATEETYFLIEIPPATPPGDYQLRLAVYGAESLERLSPEFQGLGGGMVELGEVKVAPAQKPVAPDELELALPVQQELLPGLNLIGFETLPGETVRAGQEVGASLIWQAGDPPPAGDLTMNFLAKPKEGKDWIEISTPTALATSTYPTSEWQPGEILRGWLKARIPPGFEPGAYELNLRLSPADQPAKSAFSLPVGDFQVEGWPRNFDPPQPQVDVGASYADQATLVGLDAGADTLSPGDTLTARLYWQAEAEFDQNYTVFFQLIGPDGRLYGQVDQSPGAGAFPTTGWLPGEYITDEYAVALAADAPPGPYQLAIGLYNPETGERLPVEHPACQADACLLPGLKVQR